MATGVRKKQRPSVEKDIVHPELSYQLVGLLFDVYNELGYGHREKHYESAVAAALRDSELSFKQQLHAPLLYRGNTVGRHFLDFLVEGKVVLELKQGSRLSRKDVEQVYAYLKATNLQLGIIARFTPRGLQFKRVVNVNGSHIRTDS